VGRGSQEQFSVRLVVPEVAVEVAVGIARGSAGGWRHQVRLTRIRIGMGPDGVLLFGAACWPQ
jgi:hypothetical protein